MNEPIYNYIKGKGWVIGLTPVWSAKTETRDGIAVLVELYDKEPPVFTLTGYKSNQETWLSYISDYDFKSLETRLRTPNEVWVKVTRL